MIYALKPNRVYRSYYGGRRIDALFGKQDCADSRYPEEWVASVTRAFNAGRENIVEGPSVCADGRMLSDVIAQAPEKILGQGRHGFSILVKLLDAAERLFIQCHPTVEFAKKYFDSEFGKTECWYILAADPDACVYLGFRPGITKEAWQDCFARQDTEGMLGFMHRLSVKPGDLVFVPGGVPHAIGGGCLLCELQEPTDYMVIPERTSASGIVLTDQKMHGGLGFDRMMDCFEYEGLTEDEVRARYCRHPEIKPDAVTAIVDASLTDKFRMDCLTVTTQVTVNYGDDYAVAMVTNGSCILNGVAYSQGAELFIPAGSGDLTFAGNATVMVCLP